MSKFEFATAQRIIFGNGASKDLPGIIKSVGGSRPLVVTGNAKRYQQLIDSIAPVGIYEVTGSEPTVAMAKKGVEKAREVQCDCVVAIGGGSPIDTGKIIAALVTNGGEPLDYMEVVGRGKAITQPSLPFIAVPTTAGTGAEVTRNGVLASPQPNVKASIRAATMLPAVALVDPELTLSVPPAVTAATGLDAFTQCLEPFVSVMANPLTDALARDGLRYGSRSLLAAFKDGGNVAARADMALCSLYGGLALANAKLGAVHGFAGVLGGMFPASPHGAVCARVLPLVIEANAKALGRDAAANREMLDKYAEAARICTGQPGATVADFVQWLQALCRELGVPGLSAYGMDESHIAEAVDKAHASSSMKGNSIVLSKDELTDILRKAL